MASFTPQSENPRVTEYAGFWIRVAATLLDLIILNFALALFLGGATFDYTEFHAEFRGLGLVAGWLYFALMESSDRQATPGKMIVGVIVCNDQLGKISFQQATIRHFSKYLSVIIFFVGFLMILGDVRRQSLHDRIARTFILKKSCWFLTFFSSYLCLTCRLWRNKMCSKPPKINVIQQQQQLLKLGIRKAIWAQPPL